MLPMITREQWGAKPPKSPLTPWSASPRGIVVHYSGMAADYQADHANCASRFRIIQNYHQNHPTENYVDIAYSVGSCVHGFLYELRGWGFKSGANGTADANNKYVAMLLLGNDSANRTDFTDAMKRTTKAVVAEAKQRWSSATEVHPHSFIKATSCPGNEIRSWLSAGTPLPAPPAPPAPPLYVVNDANGKFVTQTEDIEVWKQEAGEILLQQGKVGGYRK